MMNIIKLYRVTLLLIAVSFVIYLLDRTLGATVAFKTAANFKEMLAVLPPIFILLGLLEVWVPREKIISLLGEGSGAKGIFLSIFLGAAAAGPLYAAFPVAAVMLKKGARLFNIFIFLGSWSTLKIPLFLFESSAMGLNFAIYRALLNLPGIILIAFILDKNIRKEEKEEIYAKFKNQEEI